MTTNVAETSLCLTLHQPVLRLLEVVSDIGIDVLMWFIVHKIPILQADRLQARSRRATNLLLAIVVPYHLSTALEILHVNGLIKRYVLVSLLQNAVIIALVLNMCYDQYQAAKTYVPAAHHISRPISESFDPDKKTPYWDQRHTSTVSSNDGITDFELPRRAPSAPRNRDFHEASSTPASSAVTQPMAAAQITDSDAQSITQPLRVLPHSNTAAGVLLRSEVRNESVASTVDRLRKTSNDKEELLLFDIDEGLITPIPVGFGFLAAEPSTRRSIYSVASSIYSDYHDHADVSGSSASQSRSVGQQDFLLNRNSSEMLAPPSTFVVGNKHASQYSEIAWSAVDYGKRVNLQADSQLHSVMEAANNEEVHVYSKF